jgi:hypothetical protein
MHLGSRFSYYFLDNKESTLFMLLIISQHDMILNNKES